MSKIKKGDNVVVIAGRDKGKRGDVSRVVDDRRMIVNGVNTVKKHAKPNPMKNQPGSFNNWKTTSSFPNLNEHGFK